MIVTGGPQVYVPQQREGAASTTRAGRSNGSSSGGALLGKLDILSEISIRLGDGRTLSAFRFALGSSGLHAQLSSSSAMPSEEDRIEDQQMLSGFSQLAAYLGASVNKANTQLSGTAALDIRL